MLTEYIGRASEYAIAQSISESAPFHRGDRVRAISCSIPTKSRELELVGLPAEEGIVIGCDPEHRKVTVVWRTGRAATLLDDEVEAVR